MYGDQCYYEIQNTRKKYVDIAVGNIILTSLDGEIEAIVNVINTFRIYLYSSIL